ncbi:LysR substrate-binding domain-containing protein [Robiginitalea sp. SC105]|uniref:LysR substrate-binding domain-containing protein n=1 Tax=Robiginitalea sp. SC105 TaxID=2762332 RepID=UPI001639FACA|nr:LysR substrate-binding domain-containing protein [Robiginitalea sp. SC105]MBC2838457.1 LysR family transcriptional regulator [Robiginitalea sp. SC105]
MNYTLHQLQIFLKISELQSITKASEALFLTQPAVSIQLKNFQEQFPIPLTEVVGRKLFITDFGREIAQAAQKILDEVHAINYKTLAYQGELSGMLKISVVSTGKYVMPYFLSDFMREHPGVELNIDVTNKAQVVESLEANKVDFALVSVLPNLRIDRVELMQNRLFYVAARDLQLPDPRSPKRLFESVPLIYREPGSATRNAMESFISKRNYTVRNKIELTSNEAVKQAVVAGLGCSVMPVIGIKNELKNGDLQIVPVRGLPIITNWNLIWLQSKRHSPAASAFLEYVRENKEAIIQKKFDWIKAY